MSLSPEIVVQLTAYKDAGDVAGYYSVLDANGHDYGNIAYEAATDTGLWGQYANNFLENKASEYGVVVDRNALMRDLMIADYNFRAAPENNWEPIPAEDIRDYHQAVFADNGLPPAAWTGTFLDKRMGPAAWCMRCNGLERAGQTWQDALTQLLDNVRDDWSGTASEAMALNGAVLPRRS